jgi:hypothetical protein
MSIKVLCLVGLLTTELHEVARRKTQSRIYRIEDKRVILRYNSVTP